MSRSQTVIVRKRPNYLAKIIPVNTIEYGADLTSIVFGHKPYMRTIGI